MTITLCLWLISTSHKTHLGICLVSDKDECDTLTDNFFKQAEKDGLSYKFLLQLHISKEYFDLSTLIVWTN